MNLKPVLLSLFLFFSSPAFSHAQSRCIELFYTAASEFNSADITKVQEIMEELTTDRFVSFKEHAGLSVYEYLSWARGTLAYQLKRMDKIHFRDVDPRLVQHYRKLMQKKFNEIQSRLSDFKNNPLARSTPIEDLIKTDVPELMRLQSDVISFITPVNTIFAEFLAAVYFPRVLSPEVTVQWLIKNSTRYDDLLLRQISLEQLDNLKERRLDLVALDSEGVTVWIEVKYLGIDRFYAETSGHHIFEKMTNLKLLADLQTKKTRLILAVAGPGKLTDGAIRKYENIGVEVIHLTPVWNQ